MKDARDLARERVYNSLVNTLTKIFEEQYASTKEEGEYDTQEYDEIGPRVLQLANQLPDWTDYTLPLTANGLQDFEEALQDEAAKIIAKVTSS